MSVVKAQPEFSDEELFKFNKQKSSLKSFKYRLPQDRFPMPESSFQKMSPSADGDLDPAFNASVTEGFGYVNETVVQPDGKIIAVGLFQRANTVRSNGIARFNADGTLDASFTTGSGANAAIRAVIVQPDGKIIIGGAFTTFNGQNASRIVRLNSNGSIDSSFVPPTQLSGQINDMLILPDGKLLLAGSYLSNNFPLVRLNNTGSLDTVLPGFPNSTINTLSNAPDGKILFGLEGSSSLFRTNSDLTQDTTFNPGEGPNGPVYKTVVQPDGKILVAGLFDNFNGVEVDGLVRLNNNGLLDTVFEITNNPQINLYVSDLVLQSDGKIVADFYDLYSTSFADVWRFNADGTRDSTFNTNTDNTLVGADLELLADGKILVAGFFATVNNQQKLRLLRLNSDGSLDNNFNPAISSIGSVYAIKRQADGKILIGGDFEYVNGVKRTSVARINTDGTLDDTFNFNPTAFLGDINAIESQPDGKVIIGGLFNNGSISSAANVVRLNSNGSVDIPLNNLGNLGIGGIYAIALQSDGKIIIGGSIREPFSPYRILSAVRINPSGSIDNSFTPITIQNGSVRAMFIQPNGKIIIGGNFFFSTTFQRSGLARLNTDGSLDAGTFSGNSNVFSIVQQSNGSIISGGTTLTRHYSEGERDTTLNTGTGFNSQIRAVEVQPDGKIIAGGFFTTYKGSPVNRLIRVDTNGAFDAAFSANQSGTVYAVAFQPDGKLLVGGQFIDFNNTEKIGIARLKSLFAPTRRSPFDFDGDGKTDISIFRAAGGEWWIQRSSSNQVTAAQFGDGTDKIVPGDYTGDGKTDIAFYRPATGQWFVLRSEDNSFYAFPFGSNGDVPVPADFDGDGKIDPAVFRPSNSGWYILNSSGGVRSEQFGLSTDVPVPSDYDGDGKTDVGIFRPSSGQWWINRSTAGLLAVTFGDGADKPVSGDYTGDGKADIAFFRPSTGQWFVLRSENLSFYGGQFGASGDVPVPGDYDGDGKFDLAVFRSSNTGWYVNRSTAGLMIQQFGLSADKPIPTAFVP